MSNDLVEYDLNEVSTLEDLDYEKLAALTGQSSDQSSVAGLPFMAFQMDPEYALDGTIYNVPWKSFRINHPEHGFIFAKNIKARMFMNRFGYSRFDDKEKRVINYSALVKNWKTDEAPDILGTINCGRYMGWVDWSKLTEEEKKWQSGARRKRAVFMTVSGEFVTLSEETVEVDNLPVRQDFTSDSFNAIGNIFEEFDKKRVPCMSYYVNMSIETKKIGSNTIGVVTPKSLEIDWSTKIPLTKEDAELLSMFNDLVRTFNKHVMDTHNKVLKDKEQENTAASQVDGFLKVE